MEIAMFLGAYHFDGDPAALLPAYDRLKVQYPPEALDLHVCVVHEGGLTVLDACPSRSEFEDFSSGPDFAAALASAGLPTPKVAPLGDVHSALLRSPVA